MMLLWLSLLIFRHDHLVRDSRFFDLFLSLYDLHSRGLSLVLYALHILFYQYAFFSFQLRGRRRFYPFFKTLL